ncbi:hypothetical protein Q4R22_07755 [Morganella morganii subsp. sibonii]|nr:hypothetical protein [Morganella morganii]MDM8753023.1 hypothetical protein [Morganella morganii]
MTTENEKIGQQVPPYGDEPFIYSGNLDLDALIRWMEDEANKLKAIRHAITESRRTLGYLMKEMSGVIQCQTLINSMRHHPDSSLLSDSNQFSNDLNSILLHLNSHELLHRSYQGIGVSEEEKPFAEAKEN